MNFLKEGLFLLILVQAFSIISCNYKFPDKEYAVVPVGPLDYFDDVDCGTVEEFQRGLYYDGTPCESVSLCIFVG